MQLSLISTDESINVSWNNEKDIVVSSIISNNEPFLIQFQNTPLVLKGSQSFAQSSGEIFYSLQVPSKECIDVQQNDCVFKQVYTIPVLIEFQFAGVTYQRSTEIIIDLALESQLPFWMFYIAIAGLVIMMVLLIKRNNKKIKRKLNKSGSTKGKSKKLNKPITRKTLDKG